MDRLSPRQRQRSVFSRLTKAEIEKMEKLLMELREQLQSKKFCQKIASSFSSSSARAGKPIVKWTEVQSWFVARQQESALKIPSLTDTSKNESRIPQTCPLNNGHQSCQILKGVFLGVSKKKCSKLGRAENWSGLHYPISIVTCKVEVQPLQTKESCDSVLLSSLEFLLLSVSILLLQNLTQDWFQKWEKSFLISELELEAKSSKDGAWYDVDMFLTHRFLCSGEAILLDWAEEEAVRERSIPFEHSECHKERRDQSIYFDAHIVEIERKNA